MRAVSPQVENDTRWSGVMHMLESYLKIEPLLDSRDDVLRSLWLSREEHAIIESLSVPLGQLNQFTILLQKDNLSFVQARSILNGALKLFDPDKELRLASKIGEDAPLIHDVYFEKALYKIGTKKESC